MGFGFLLLGYMMMVEIGVRTSDVFNIGFEIFPDVIGYILFFLALKKLESYASGFKYAKFLSYPLLALGSIKFIAQLSSLLVKYTALSFGEDFPAIVSNILGGCEFAKISLLSLFSLFLFSGIRALSKEVELPKISNRAIAAMLMNLIYFVVRISVYIFPFNDAEKAFMYYVYTITWYLLLFFTIFLVFNCYMYICYEGEEDIIVPQSKFSSFIKRNRKR